MYVNLVDDLIWGQEVAGSNPATQTRQFGGSSGLRVILARLLTRRVQLPRLPPNNGTIAPMVEQWTENSCVAGSNPACATNHGK